MRFNSISLSWFRGAATEVALSPEGKSVVVYGSNGSGKSSFVDAIELAINGKISHLSHEYSGKRQERGVPNTHCKPSDATRVRVRFQDGTERLVAIAKDGAFTSTGSEAPVIASWDYKRTVLRQNEVSAFIGDTKGDKYSAILPLLGLGALELTAENLRKVVEVANSVLDGVLAAEGVARTENLIEYLAALEQSVRDQLKSRANDVIAEISADVQSMWSMLHPDKLIDGVALHMPPGIDKAIDIRLSFHGVAQDSPRLTLSEG